MNLPSSEAEGLALLHKVDLLADLRGKIGIALQPTCPCNWLSTRGIGDPNQSLPFVLQGHHLGRDVVANLDSADVLLVGASRSFVIRTFGVFVPMPFAAAACAIRFALQLLEPFIPALSTTISPAIALAVVVFSIGLVRFLTCSLYRFFAVW